MKIYSPHPPSAYTVEVDGVREGIGCHRAFDNNLGAWNILWLTTNIMDEFLKHQEFEPNQYAYSSKLLPPVVGTAYQNLSSGKEVGELTLELEPEAWLKEVMADDIFPDLIMVQLYGQDWIECMQERMAQYHQNSKANIINVNFNRVS